MLSGGFGKRWGSGFKVYPHLAVSGSALYFICQKTVHDAHQIELQLTDINGRLLKKQTFSVAGGGKLFKLDSGFK